MKREAGMAWRMVEIPDSECRANDFSDEDVLCLYLTLRDRMKAPYDDSNPAFVCYLKLSTPFNEARRHTEDKRS
jgi:hypothetical protein